MSQQFLLPLLSTPKYSQKKHLYHINVHSERFENNINIIIIMTMMFISLLVCMILANDQSTVSALTSNTRTAKFPSASPLLSSTILEPAAVSQAQPAFDRVAWETGFSTCKKEVCEVISTSLPLDIKGTYYRYCSLVVS